MEMGGGGDDEGQIDSPLFTPSPSPEPFPSSSCNVAETTCSHIPGLYYFSDFFSHTETYEIVEQIRTYGYFDVGKGRDQAVIFGSSHSAKEHDKGDVPEWTRTMLRILERRLVDPKYCVPQHALDALFAPHITHDGAFSRQLILNTYSPGQGIASHVDIPHRFLDGIMIISFGSGITMDFARTAINSSTETTTTTTTTTTNSVYLTPNSVCILTGESRWQWTHGIEARTFDLVRTTAGSSRVERKERGQRLSITVRWLNVRPEGDTNDEHQDLRR